MKQWNLCNKICFIRIWDRSAQKFLRRFCPFKLWAEVSFIKWTETSWGRMRRIPKQDMLQWRASFLKSWQLNNSLNYFCIGISGGNNAIINSDIRTISFSKSFSSLVKLYQLNNKYYLITVVCHSLLYIMSVSVRYRASLWRARRKRNC